MTCLRKTFPFVRPYLFENILSLIFSVISLLSYLVIPYMMKILLDDILIKGKWELMGNFTLIGIGVVVIANVSKLLAGYFYVSFAEKIVIDARTNLYSHLVLHDLSFFNKYQLGDLVNRFQDDTGAIHGLFSFVLSTIFINVVMIVLTVCIMLKMNVTLTLIVVCSLPIYLLVSNSFSSRIKRNVAYRRQEIGVLLNFIFDTLGKVIILKNFIAEQQAIRRIRQISSDLKKFIVKNEMLNYFANSTTSFTTQFVGVLLLIFGAHFVGKGLLTAGGLVAFYQYLNSLFSPVLSISNQIVFMNQVIIGSERYFELIDDEGRYTTPSGPLPLTTVQGEIHFSNVSFGYTDDQILQDINLCIKPQEKIAILGRSGIGKTTLAMLLKRFYTPDQGQILLDGTDITEYAIADLRKTIGFLNQEPLIFEGTIQENLAIAKENVTLEECWAVLSLVDLHELVADLPAGLDTPLGNNGAQLSGGQKQRLSIARLILQNSPIIVFDEVFSHLDRKTENIIWNNLKGWLTDKTVIFITHQLWEPDYFDRLVFLNKIIEAEGSYIELRSHPLLKGRLDFLADEVDIA